MGTISEWFDTAVYDIKRTTYDFTGLGTPPVVLPADSITTPQAEALRTDAKNLPSAFDVLVKGTGEGIQDLGSGVKTVFNQTMLLLIVAGLIVLYFIYQKEFKNA